MNKNCLNTFRIIKNHEIDFEKWDQCVARSNNPSVYALSWYLNIVSPGWNALVCEDYQCAFPITPGRSTRNKLLLRPILAQRFDLYGQHNIVELKDVMSCLKKDYWGIILNLECPVGNSRIMVNQILKLNGDYHELKKKYSSQVNRKIKKGIAEGLYMTDLVEVDDFLWFTKNESKYQYSTNEIILIESIVRNAIRLNQGTITGICNDKGLISAAFWLHSFKRFILLLPVSSEIGYKQNGMTFILDHFIKTHASTGKIIDFEGSNISGIAQFNKGFGAWDEYYFEYKSGFLAYLYSTFKKILSRK